MRCDFIEMYFVLIGLDRVNAELIFTVAVGKNLESQSKSKEQAFKILVQIRYTRHFSCRVYSKQNLTTF